MSRNIDNIDNRPTTAEVGVKLPVSGRLSRRGLIAGFGGSAALLLLAGCQPGLTPAQQTALARLDGEGAPKPAAKPAGAATTEPGIAPTAPTAPVKPVAPTAAPVGPDALATARAQGREEGRAEARAAAPASTATADTRAATAPTAVPAAQPQPAKPGYFNLGGESYRVLTSQGALGQRYEALVTDRKPQDFGLPARPSRFTYPASIEEFQKGILENEARQLDIDQFFAKANLDKFHNYVVSRDCWNAQRGWCNQSPDVTFGVGSLTDNMQGTVMFDSPGQHTVKKVDQGIARATLEEALFLDARYADDGRWGSIDGKARRIIQGADVFLRIAKGVPFRTVLFATNPVTGEWITDLPGHVMSEGSEMGLVLPVAPRNNGGPSKTIGYVLTYDMKPDREDARHEFHISRGPTAADGAKKHNLLDVRNHGIVLNLR